MLTERTSGALYAVEQFFDPRHHPSAPELVMSRILLLPFSKVDRFPVELLSEIFLLIVQDWSGHRTKLMLVCRRWRAIVLSIPGIHSQLTIGRATQKEVVQAFIQGRKSRLHVRVDMNDERHGSDFNAEKFRACVIAAAQATSRWSALTLISPPPHGEYKTLQISQPFVHLTAHPSNWPAVLGSSLSHS